MNDKDLQNKLHIQASQQTLFINLPGNIAGRLGETMLISSLPKSASMHYDFILIFVKNQEEIERQLLPALKMVKPEDGFMWVAYPKKTSGIATELEQDKGWNSVLEQDWHPVSTISIDDTWSAFRLSPGKI